MNDSMRSALIVRGGWDGHQPRETTDLFVPFLEEHGFSVRVEETSAVYADTAELARVDLVVQCNTMNVIEPSALEGLIRAVRHGTGLVGWHGGIVDSYRGSADYVQLIGGQFAHHPPTSGSEDLPDDEGRNFVRHTIEIVAEKADHPLVTGLTDFELITEQYWVLSDDYNDVVATTTLAARDFDPWNRPVTCPAVWTRQWGAGRIVVVTPGHSLEVVQDPSVRTIIERGLLWAAR